MPDTKEYILYDSIWRLKTDETSLWCKKWEWLLLEQVFCGCDQHRFFWDVGNILFLDLGASCMSLFRFENNLAHLVMQVFYVCVFYLYGKE